MFLKLIVIQLFINSVTAALPRLSLTVEVEGQVLGYIIVELRSDVVPKTANNFETLCLAESSPTYKGNIFFRIIPGFIIQSGDVVYNNGTGNKSIYGPTFDDENFRLKHTGQGILSMANRGKNTNGSQFFITLDKTEWLDGKHVVFGRVVEGMEVVTQISTYGSQNGKTRKTVTITKCARM